MPRASHMILMSGCVQMFMERYNPDAANFTKNPEKYIKFSVQDVARLIMDDLFEAKEKDSVAAAKGGATQFGRQVSEAPSSTG